MPSLSSVSSESDIIAKVEAAENKITKDHGGGNVYYGQIILCNFGKEKMHGYGTYTGAYGWKYMGEYKKGKKDGNGTWTSSASGQKYVGEFKDGKRHGQGTCTLANGTIHHSGEWLYDAPKQENTGREVTTSTGNTKEQSVLSESHIIARVEAAEDKITKKYEIYDHDVHHDIYTGDVYYGQTYGGKRHGYGTFTYTNGDIYVGEYMNDNQHGQGTYINADGTIKHSGEWVNNEPAIVFANGDFWDGPMEDGEAFGYGKYTFVHNNIALIYTFVGDWKNTPPANPAAEETYYTKGSYSIMTKKCLACTHRDQHVQHMYETWETQTKEQNRESFADVCLEAICYIPSRVCGSLVYISIPCMWCCLDPKNTSQNMLGGNFLRYYVGVPCCLLIYCIGFIVGLVYLIAYLNELDDSSSVSNHTNATVAGRMLDQLVEVGVVAATKILRG